MMVFISYGYFHLMANCHTKCLCMYHDQLTKFAKGLTFRTLDVQVIIYMDVRMHMHDSFYSSTIVPSWSHMHYLDDL